MGDLSSFCLSLKSFFPRVLDLYVGEMALTTTVK